MKLAAESSIGTAASHGCVRMLNQDVIELGQLLIDTTGAPIEPGATGQRFFAASAESGLLESREPLPVTMSGVARP